MTGPQDAGTPPSSGRVVVGVDGSPSSETALGWAIEHARATGRPVDAVSVWEFPATYGILPGPEHDFHGQAAQVLDKSVRNTVGADDVVRVRQRVLRGHPARALLDAAEGADLLVVGCRGHGGFAGMLLGSVSQHVAAHAACPVVVVHAHGPSAPDESPTAPEG
jgi:nucleotide-binding universal stress UspA family protein